MNYFNPRSRVGNDNIFCFLVYCKKISIHVPAWGTTLFVTAFTVCNIFQSTFPRGERRTYTITKSQNIQDFNPRSRVGNDYSCVSPLYMVKISIHVPAWGTTFRELVLHESIRTISIHVPAWGTTSNLAWIIGGISISIHVPAWGTTASHIDSNDTCRFQSTFPRGERPRGKVALNPMVFISIHVPAWGTTKKGKSRNQIRHISIHVPAWGTTKQFENDIRPDKFQSTFPRGERPVRLTLGHS